MAIIRCSMFLQPVGVLVAASSLIAAVSAQQGDWASNWTGTERSLTNAFDVDPLDSRSTLRGSGDVTLGNGIAKFYGSPRLYISQEAGVEGWENVEITAYGKYVNQGATSLPYSGLTLVTRSNHDNYKSEPCDAFGYYARIYSSSGECAFQKEYYHSSVTGTVYSPSKRVPCFSDGLPMNQWVGMKFKVTTEPGTSNVRLELYLDENNDGNWQLRHSVVDTPGFWSSTSSTTVPSECPQNDGDTVLRPGNVSFLRTDGSDLTNEVHWRDATIVNSLTTSAPTKAPTTAPVKFTVGPTTSPVAPVAKRYICSKNPKSDDEVCASGLPVTSDGPCLQVGDSCGGPKRCWVVEGCGSPPSVTPPPTSSVTPPPTGPAPVCSSPSCGCTCPEYSGSTDCRSCGCKWKGGCS